MSFTLPELPYAHDALQPYMSRETLEFHHDKHHKAYVDGANTALDKLAEVRSKGDFATIAQLERNLAFNVSGHVLHSVFWTNLSPDGGGQPTGPLAAALDEGFGGFEPFRRQMVEAAASIQGSGWALASWEPMAERLVVQQVHDHQGQHGQGTVPLLAIDAWEHAYYLQYENKKADFFEAVWNVVSWRDVGRRYEAARAADIVLA
jgi:Fe-Mn family superoxide dismutase